MKNAKALTDKAAVKAYVDWQRRPEIGCTFARRIAVNPANYHRHVQVVRGSVPLVVATALDGVISTAVGDPSVTSAAVLLPEVTKLEVLVGLALELGSKSPSWDVKRTLLPQTPAGPLVAFHMSRQIPFNTGTCPSEALVLGDFKVFPNTRRAPLTAMEIFVGVPMPNDPKGGKPTTKANLAHLQLPYPSHAAFHRAWSSAEEGRAESLGVPLRVAEKDDLRAKAKVSFVVSLAIAKKLGCHP